MAKINVILTIDFTLVIKNKSRVQKINQPSNKFSINDIQFFCIVLLTHLFYALNKA